MGLRGDKSMEMLVNMNFSVSLQTFQEVVNVVPKSTNVSGLCDSKKAVLQLTADGQIKNLTFVFTLVRSASICSFYGHALREMATRWRLEPDRILRFFFLNY